MEPLEATPLRVTVDELDIGIDIFKLVIRLSKAKQLAFLLLCFLCCPAAPAVPVNLTECISASVKPVRTTRNLVFSLQLKLLKRHVTMKDVAGRHTPFRCGLSCFLWFSGEVEHIVHLIPVGCVCVCNI